MPKSASSTGATDDLHLDVFDGGFIAASFKGVVNCQNSRDKGPPEGNSARG